MKRKETLKHFSMRAAMMLAVLLPASVSAQEQGTTGDLTWKVEVPQAGLYNIRLDYLTVESRGIDIEREIAYRGSA